ncbi:MAG: hypothetical protein ACK452_09600 [Bacteroidota bacterium]|jgi:hypothetical protein
MKNLFNRTLSVLLLLIVLFSATPKIYIHSFSGHHHEETIELCHHDSSQISASKEKCSFQKLDSPVNYAFYGLSRNSTCFHFVSKIKFSNLTEDKLSEEHYTIKLRGPPTATLHV